MRRRTRMIGGGSTGEVRATGEVTPATVKPSRL